MNMGRHSFGLSSVDNVIYAIGGLENSTALSTVEMYDPRIGKWHQVGNLQNPRFGAACTAMKGGLIAIGGCFYDGTIQATGEYYDTRIRMSMMLQNLKMPRVDATAIFMSETLYVVGGCDSQSVPLTTIEVLPTPYNNRVSMEYAFSSKSRNMTAMSGTAVAATSAVFHAACPINSNCI